MKVSVEEINPVKKKISVTVQKDAVNEEFDKTYKALGKKAKVRGFRPGKVPLHILKQQFKEQVEADATENLFKSTYPNALTEAEINPITYPEVDTVGAKEGEEFAYTATVEIMPEDGADPEQTIEPTFFNQYVDMPLVAPPPPVSVDFLAFEKAPELLEAAVPEYPDIARKAGVEGLVVVWVLIDETGRVISAEIAASDAPVLNQASLDAAYRHRFLPAYQRDVAVKSRISLRFRFVLSD